MLRSRMFPSTAVLCLVSCCLAGEAFRFADDFAGHKAGSDGAPVWTTEGFDWTVAKGRYVATSFARDFAFPARAPHAKRVVIKATIVLEKAVSKDWKIAGLAVVHDERNFWHLALIEGPEKKQRRHYLELCEMLDGTWLSQSAPATRLTEVERKSSDVAWQYGTPYRLKLELSEERIRGSLADAEGKELAAVAFKLDNRAVKSGRPALTCSGFTVAFDDVAMTCDRTVPAPEKEQWMFPPYTQAGRVPLPAEPRGKASGFFHVEQHGGRWWTIDPKGRPFFILGTDHANYRAHWCEKLGYAPYHRNMVKQFGGDESKWAESTAERLLAWGFNSLSAGHSESLRGRGLAWMGFISFGSRFSSISDLCPKTTWTGFPNVFHPKFPAWCDRLAKRQCARFKDDPWLLGYFLDNELEWYGKEHREWSLTDEVFKKPADHSGKQALMGFLKKRYPKIGQLSQAWGAKVASYDALAKSTDVLKHHTERGRQDKLDFLRVIAEKYFSITTAAIQRHDPNHMVLGCRFAGGMPGGIGEIAGKYCDIYTINCYRWVDLETGEIRGFEDDLDEWYAEVKRPFMITEWSFPALDSGLPCKHGAGQRFDTQQQKAKAFTLFQRFLFSRPFMVGSNYFMWVDEPALGISSTFPEDSNYGLVNVDNKPYEPLVQAAAKLQPQVYDIHSGRVPVLSVRMEQQPWRAVIRNAGKVDARATLEITRGGTTQRRPIAVAAGKALEVALGEPPLEPPTPLPGAKAAGAVKLERKGDGWTVDNGVLQLIKERAGGNAFDRVLLRGTGSGADAALALKRNGKARELGLFVPVIWQDVGQDLWPKPDSAKIVGASNGSVRLVLDIEFELKPASGQKVITTVDEDGRFADAARRPGAFKTCYRFYVYPNEPWFGVRFLWLENTDTRPWKFQAYFHYALSSLAGDASDDEVGGPGVPMYYAADRAVTWFDPKAKLHYGIAQGRSGNFRMNFWKDPAGGEHADVRREIKVQLHPGQRYIEPQPTAYVFGAAGETGKDAWMPIAEEVRRWEAVQVKVIPLKK